jgi:hypothetical protein
MINNESHFSDNGNGSMGFSTGQYWAMLLWSIDWNVQTMNAFIRVRKGKQRAIQLERMSGKSICRIRQARKRVN